ncbi:hypothetical protein ACFUTX_08165 [Microbacterium sp. NPDC057407]|uniref:hypothetical protein n=1 Tax=Microbacterium sp. NPDC057407 TaxID=3346120 RepID=UPI00367129B8
MTQLREAARSASPLLVVGALAFALSACAPTPGAAPTDSSAPTPSASASPTATPVATPTPEPAALPSDCSEVGTAETRAATVDGLMLQSDGVGFVRPAPSSAKLMLGCGWFAGDATGVMLLISHVDPDEAAEYAATLPSEGYDCTTGDAGNPVCQKVTPNSDYPVDTVETIVSREDVWIYLSTSNVDGDPLLSDLNAAIWPPS